MCVYVDFLLFQPIIDARRLIDRRPRFSDLLLSRPPPPPSNVDSAEELDTPRFVKVLLFISLSSLRNRFLCVRIFRNLGIFVV